MGMSYMTELALQICWKKKKKGVLIIDLEWYGGKCTWILSSHYRQNLIHLN